MNTYDSDTRDFESMRHREGVRLGTAGMWDKSSPFSVNGQVRSVIAGMVFDDSQADKPLPVIGEVESMNTIDTHFENTVLFDPIECTRYTPVRYQTDGGFYHGWIVRRGREYVYLHLVALDRTLKLPLAEERYMKEVV